MKLILFDCDGTLVDSQSIIHANMALAFQDFGHPDPGAATVRSIIGLSLDRAVARLLGRDVDAEATAIAARYKEHFFAYRAGGGPMEPMYDGMADLVRSLAAQPEAILGVVTGKSRRGLRSILEHYGLSPLFLTSRTADDCPSKPNPAMVLECCMETGIDPADAIVVGDAVFDMEMARNAGAAAFGVSWGYAPVEHLIRAGAHHIAHDAAELGGLLGPQGVRDARLAQ
jgi:phosphoglycolate phosphatase